jgi:lipopolysaccharide/colanic/teichoic acid biosynthesis glycosyltransferase
MLYAKPRTARQAAVSRAPAQLLLAICAAVVLPFLAYGSFLRLGLHDPQAQHATLASLAGLVLGFWLNRSVSDLPGTAESSSILPSYLLSFGAVLLTILFARIQYSRVLLLAGFVLSIAWSYGVYMLTQRQRMLMIGIVRGGRVEAFETLPNVVAVPIGLDDPVDHLDAITADFRHDHSDEWERRLSDCVLEGIPVYHSKDLLESLTGRADLEHLAENNLGSLAPLSSLQTAKHLLDRLLAIPALIVVSPILLATAAAIRLTSPGPVLFRQKRIGFRARPFEMLKFRTMTTVSSGSADRNAFITQAGDSRITPLGAILRRTRIDELPQIINILRGEMSWIGPRPEAVKLAEWYERELPFYRYRHVVMPGLTGWAQVTQGHVADLSSVSEKLQYDFYYIRNFSVWLELLIVAKTLKTILTGVGSR